MSTIDTSTWNPDADLNTAIEGIPLNNNASIAQTWQALRVLMAAVKGDGDAIKSMIDVMQGATASADGASGLVPKPEAGDQDKFLKGDGTWDEPETPSVSWSDVTGKPSTFTPSSHTHGSITNDGKLGTASRAVVTDGNRAVGVSSVTAAELSCLSGVTASVQTQLDAKLEEPDLCNWQKTEKAGAVAFYPVGNSPLEGTVEFKFSETGPASGDKGPENPSTISGVSSAKVTRCGKNLCPLVGESSSSHISVSFTDNGEFVFNGSYVGIVNVYVFNKPNNKNLFPSYLERGKTYTFSLQGDNSSVSFDVYRYYETNYGGAAVSIAPGESRIYTIPDTQSMILRFNIPANIVLNDAKFKLQIEEGSSATEFEPYAGTDYTLPLGSTYYGGTVDLATGVMTVSYNGIVLNGTEDWMAGAPGNYNRYTLVISPNAKSVARLENCTHFLAEGTLSTDTEHFYATGGGVHFFSIQPDLASWKSWLAAQSQAGTPVIFTYFIDPYTVQLTPQQILSLAQTSRHEPRLNTVYTDTQTVQVGYQRIFDESRIIHLPVGASNPARTILCADGVWRDISQIAFPI